jgi:hypothetical protein
MSTTIIDPITRVDVAGPAPPSAVSWGAIVAGGAAAAALSLVMLILGTGFGLAAVSPWSQEGVSAETFGASTIVWITLTQLLASAIGGYIAGRLRAKWSDAASDEVYFRDTAHGFLAWCVATLGTAAVLGTAIGSIATGTLQAGAAVAGQAAQTAVVATSAAAANGRAGGEQGGAGASDANPLGYFVDSLFRPAGPGQPEASEAQQAASQATEVTRIFANALRTGSLPDEDARYVATLVAQRTDLGEREAEQRVRDSFAKVQTTLREAEEAVRSAADEARAASAYAALWLVVSLLVGAFVASLLAIYGGRQRDL